MEKVDEAFENKKVGRSFKEQMSKKGGKGEKEEDEAKLEPWAKELKDFKKNGNKSGGSHQATEDAPKPEKKESKDGKDSKEEESAEMKEFHKAKEELKKE